MAGPQGYFTVSSINNCGPRNEPSINNLPVTKRKKDPTAAKRMRLYRQRLRLRLQGETVNESNDSNDASMIRTKDPTAAKRMRLYRQRLRLRLQGEAVNESNSDNDSLMIQHKGSHSSKKFVPIPPKKSAPPPPPQPTQSTEVCLKWNSYHSNMQATFPSLLNNEQFVDVTLACEGRSIKCHKVMLSACSPYFEDLLSQNPCQNPIVLIKDLKFWEVQALVEFVYSGEVNVAQEQLPSLLAAAEALQIKGLTGPSLTSSNIDDNLSCTGADYVHPEPQKRIRKHISAYPLAYPISIQNTPSPSPSGNKMQLQQQEQTPPIQVQKIKVPIMSPISGTSHHPDEPSHHPPVRIKLERDSTPPLVLLKEEPLDLDIDFSEQNKEDNTGQIYSYSDQDAIDPLNGNPLLLNQGSGLVKMESDGS